MDDAADVLLSLAITAFRSERDPVRVHVQRTDRVIDYRCLSLAELSYLLEALLLTEGPEPGISTNPDICRGAAREACPTPLDQDRDK